MIVSSSKPVLNQYIIFNKFYIFDMFLEFITNTFYNITSF